MPTLHDSLFRSLTSIRLIALTTAIVCSRPKRNCYDHQSDVAASPSCDGMRIGPGEKVHDWLSGSNTRTRSNTVGLLNIFNATVWATPLLVGFVMSQCLRRKMRRIGRAAMWVTYLAWGWRWAVIWDEMWSGGSGRYAVENLIFIWGVWGTIGLGVLLMVWPSEPILCGRGSSVE